MRDRSEGRHRHRSRPEPEARPGRPYDLATELGIAAVLSSIDTAELGAEPLSVGG